MLNTILYGIAILGTVSALVGLTFIYFVDKYKKLGKKLLVIGLIVIFLVIAYSLIAGSISG
jgi:hypothetical protein